MKKNKIPKIAVIHDYLCGIGGSEKVFQYICEEFSEADIYTLAYNPEKAPSFFKQKKINTTWLNFFVRSMNTFRWSFLLATYVMKSINLKEYDIVLTSSATVAKYVIVPNGKHICYCYIPTRAIWQSKVYFRQSIISFLIKPFLNYLQENDYNAAQKVHSFIAISKVTQKNIKKIYHKDSKIIPSPINLNNFFSQTKTKNYLIVSRLEKWKKIEYAIEAFNILKLPLKIIGCGSEEKKLKQLANSNISFLGEVDEHTLALEYSSAKAVIFTPYLEYGLIPLEANASGTAVICYGKGGVLETMIPVDSSNLHSEHPTSVFFYKQTSRALIRAVRKFENYSFPPELLIKHANQWGVSRFKKRIRAYINNIEL